MTLKEEVSRIQKIMGLSDINENDLLSEKLTNVEDDVDMLYDMYFKNNVESISKTRFLSKNMLKTIITNTGILKNELCIKAHTIEPCEIIINPSPDGSDYCNYYSSVSHKIGLSFGGSFLALLDEHNGSLDKALYDIPNSQREKFLIEFSEYRVKGSIHHELAHWIDNNLNNNHIKKTMLGYANLPAGEAANKIKTINAHYFEIQAQIHNIKQMYNSHKLEWDNYTFNDMLELSPIFSFVKYLPESFRISWIKNIKKRMNREGLLGKNMR